MTGLHCQYKETVKQLSSLRQLVPWDAGEKMDYDEYVVRAKMLLNKHIVGVDVIVINNLQQNQYYLADYGFCEEV